MTRPLKHVVSLSGGKDSEATALVARESVDPVVPREDLLYVFADTGNEHRLTYDHIDYLETVLGKIHRLRASFDREIAGKRAYVLEHWPEKGVPAAVVERAAKALVPSGNPYLDLCLWKGRFPSRKAQFCTEYLKTTPLVEFQMALIDAGADVWSWQGVRRDESATRRRAKEVRGGRRGPVHLPADRALVCSRHVRRDARGRRKAQPALRDGDDQGGVHAVHQRREGRGPRDRQALPRGDRPHRRVGDLRGAGEQKGGNQLFPQPRARRAPRQEGHLQGGALGSNLTGGRQYNLLRQMDDEPAEGPSCKSSYGLCE